MFKSCGPQHAERMAGGQRRSTERQRRRRRGDRGEAEVERRPRPVQVGRRARPVRHAKLGRMEHVPSGSEASHRVRLVGGQLEGERPQAVDPERAFGRAPDQCGKGRHQRLAGELVAFAQPAAQRAGRRGKQPFGEGRTGRTAGGIQRFGVQRSERHVTLAAERVVEARPRRVGHGLGNSRRLGLGTSDPALGRRVRRGRDVACGPEEQPPDIARRHAVNDGVVDLEEDGEPAGGCAAQDVQLPQRVGAVEQPGVQVRHQARDLPRPARRRDRCLVDVTSQIGSPGLDQAVTAGASGIGCQRPAQRADVGEALGQVRADRVEGDLLRSRDVEEQQPAEMAHRAVGVAGEVELLQGVELTHQDNASSSSSSDVSSAARMDHPISPCRRSRCSPKSSQPGRVTQEMWSPTRPGRPRP